LSIDIRAWKTDATVASSRFSLDIPAGAKKLTPENLRDFDELPGMFAMKRAKGR